MDTATGPALRRDLALLQALADAAASGEAGAGVVRLATLVQRDKSQVSRALQSLAVEGLVERDEVSRHYRLGWRLFALAARAANERLLRLAAPVLRQLATELGQGAHLCVEVGNQAVTVLSHLPRAGFGVGAEGVGVSMVHTSLGRALLVDKTFEELRARFSDADFAMSGPNHRVKSLSDLVRELDSIRRVGYALVDEDWAAGVIGASAPVRDFRERVVAALNISAKRNDFLEHLPAAGELLAERALALGRQLGSTAAPHEYSPIATPS